MPIKHCGQSLESILQFPLNLMGESHLYYCWIIHTCLCRACACVVKCYRPKILTAIPINSSVCVVSCLTKLVSCLLLHMVCCYWANTSYTSTHVTPSKLERKARDVHSEMTSIQNETFYTLKQQFNLLSEERHTTYGLNSTREFKGFHAYN